jgi:hypothetical protein
MVPNVEMKGWGSLSFVSRTPFNQPASAPTARHTKIAKIGLIPHVTDTIPAQIIAKARIDPIDKSIPAVRIGSNIPNDNNALMDDCRAIFIKLSAFKKLGVRIVRITHSATKPKSAPNLLMKFFVFDPLFTIGLGFELVSISMGLDC